jgi:hypothetical protein
MLGVLWHCTGLSGKCFIRGRSPSCSFAHLRLITPLFGAIERVIQGQQVFWGPKLVPCAVLPCAVRLVRYCGMPDPPAGRCWQVSSHCVHGPLLAQCFVQFSCPLSTARPPSCAMAVMCLKALSLCECGAQVRAQVTPQAETAVSVVGAAYARRSYQPASDLTGRIWAVHYSD